MTILLMNPYQHDKKNILRYLGAIMFWSSSGCSCVLRLDRNRFRSCCLPAHDLCAARNANSQKIKKKKWIGMYEIEIGCMQASSKGSWNCSLASICEIVAASDCLGVHTFYVEWDRIQTESSTTLGTEFFAQGPLDRAYFTHLPWQADRFYGKYCQ
jgi:hypothetical protein